MTQDIAPSLLSLNAGLLAVAVTVLTFVPALLELVSTQPGNYFSSVASRRQLASSFELMRLTLWGFGTAVCLSILGLFISQLTLTVILVAISLVTLVTLLVASFMIAGILTKLFH